MRPPLEVEPQLGLELPREAVVRPSLLQDLAEVRRAEVRKCTRGLSHSSKTDGIRGPGMVQHVRAIDAELKRLCFADLKRLAEIRIE